VRRFASIEVYAAYYTQHTEITLQDIPRLKYTLRLFIGNDERDLRREDNWTWTPAQRSYVPYFLTTYTLRIQCVCRGVSPGSQMRVDIQMKSGHGPWAKKEQTSKLIDLQRLFNQDQSSKAHQPTVLGQSWFSASPLVLTTETLRGD